MPHAHAGSSFVLDNGRGLRAEITSNGTLRRFSHNDIVLNLFPGAEAEPGLGNLYLRKLGDEPAAIPLLGPQSPSRFSSGAGSFFAEGVWGDIAYVLRLTLAEEASAWSWQVRLENLGNSPIEFDLIHVQDLAVAPYGAIRLNEYYVSQYLDHAPLQHPTKGVVVASRQNQAVQGRYPWTLIGSLRRARSFSTDALQFFGLERRQERPVPGTQAGLPGVRLQHEHAMVGIQDQMACLAPGEVSMAGFFGWFEEDHPEATSPSDLAFVDRAALLFDLEVLPASSGLSGQSGAQSLFVRAPALKPRPFDDLELDRLFGSSRRDCEWRGDLLQSFFVGERTHVALMAKEEVLLRPHGHLLRTGGAFLTDEAALTSTVWMGGVFHSMVTQGHVSINRFLSTTHSYLSLFQSHGLRVFVDDGSGWLRLGLPSAFVMEPGICRWLYRHENGLIEVVSTAETERHALGLEVRILEGQAMRVLMTLHVALNGDDGAIPVPVTFRHTGNGCEVSACPESDLGRRFPGGCFTIRTNSEAQLTSVLGDEALYEDGHSRGEPFLCLEFSPTSLFSLEILGNLVADSVVPGLPADAYWRSATLGLRLGAESDPAVQRLATIMPWFAHNALIHFLSPRGLEQYSGGGWGTRDVCQGPLEYLLAIHRPESVRQMLLTVFHHQNPDGDWPQWFMFFERDKAIRPGDSHGDIVFWPLLATAQYIEASGDIDFLKLAVPFFEDGKQEGPGVFTILDHMLRALEVISQRLIPGTKLEAYGHGDWNDSLQPADPALREHLCSAWTVTLHYQVLLALAKAFAVAGESALSTRFELEAGEVLSDFRRYLLVDGVIPGYANFEDPAAVTYLLHPLDHKTGLRYSLLPMIHAIINHMLAPAEALSHLELIREHLMGPDGARLFDAPMVYRGGPMRIFQRAETATFFGREIGLMYTHAHIRYAEALWQYGDAEGFFDAISKVVPTGFMERVASAAARQSNCYFSSSDAAFKDRYEAFEDYEKALHGEVMLEGGWRVYSSGAGIASGLILRAFFGVQATCRGLRIDPMLPPGLQGLKVGMDLYGQSFEIEYDRGSKGFGPLAVVLNGESLPMSTFSNPYRASGVFVDVAPIQRLMCEGQNHLLIRLG